MPLTKFKKRLSAAFMSLVIIFSTLAPAAQVVHAEAAYSLTDTHDYRDIYASVIFSNGNEGVASGAVFSYEQLAKYPDMTGNSTPRYGVLNESSRADAGSPGAKLSNLFATYQKYNWLTHRPHNSKANPIAEFWDWMTNGIVDEASKMGLDIILATASFGAQLYEFADGFIVWLQKQVLGLDVMQAIGLRAAEFAIGHTPGAFATGADPDPNTKNAVRSSGVIHTIITNVTAALGFDHNMITAVASLIWSFLTFAMIIAVMNEIRKGQLGKASSRFSRYFIRGIVILSTFFLTGMLQEVVDNAANELTNDFSSPSLFSESIVVDSLLWASTQNLSFDAIPANEAHSTISNSPGIGEPIREFKPTYDNIKAINNASYAIAKEANFKKGDIYIGINQGKSTMDATEHIDALASRELFSVNEYLKLIDRAHSEVNDGGKLYAAAGPKIGDSFRDDSYVDKDEFYTERKIASAVFFSDRGDDDDINDKAKEKNKAAMFAFNEVTTDAQNPTRGYNVKTIGGTSRAGAMNKDARNGAELLLPFSERTPFTYNDVIWNKTSTYIYGSVTNNSKATANFNNYIYGSGTTQNRNPIDGSDDYTVLEELSEKRSGTNGDKRWAEKLLNANAYTIALHNRFNGKKDGSLSTQSVAFLLQTELSNEGQVEYVGYNTTYTKSDKGKPKGGDGVTYVRYIIPNTGIDDLVMRAGMLGVIWIMTGCCAMVAFFYLMKAPIFTAVVKMIAASFSAFFTGNLPALLEYLAYYAAMLFSFTFARIGIYFGTTIGTYLLNAMPSWARNLMVGNIAGQDALVEGTVNNTGEMISALAGNDNTNFTFPGIATIIFALSFTWLMTWPIVEVRLGQRSSKPRKVGLIGLFVMIPYIIAEAFDEYLDTFHYMLYGRRKSQSFMSKLGNQVQAVDQKEMVKQNAAKALQGGMQIANAGAALATGGISALGMAAAKHAGGKVLGGIAGAGGMLDENGNAFDEKGNIIDEFGTNNQLLTDEELGKQPDGVLGKMGRGLDNIMNRANGMTNGVDNALTRFGRNVGEDLDQDIDMYEQGIMDKDEYDPEDPINQARREERLAEDMFGQKDAFGTLREGYKPTNAFEELKDPEPKYEKSLAEVETEAEMSRINNAIKDRDSVANDLELLRQVDNGLNPDDLRRSRVEVAQKERDALVEEIYRQERVPGNVINELGEDTGKPTPYEKAWNDLKEFDRTKGYEELDRPEIEREKNYRDADGNRVEMHEYAKFGEAIKAKSAEAQAVQLKPEIDASQLGEIKPDIKLDQQPLQSEIKLDQQPLQSDIKLDQQPLQTEIKADQKPVQAEIKPDQPIQSEIKTSQPVQAEIQPTQPIKSDIKADKVDANAATVQPEKPISKMDALTQSIQSQTSAITQSNAQNQELLRLIAAKLGNGVPVAGAAAAVAATTDKASPSEQVVTQQIVQQSNQPQPQVVQQTVQQNVQAAPQTPQQQAQQVQQQNAQINDKIAMNPQYAKDPKVQEAITLAQQAKSQLDQVSSRYNMAKQAATTPDGRVDTNNAQFVAAQAAMVAATARMQAANNNIVRQTAPQAGKTIIQQAAQARFQNATDVNGKTAQKNYFGRQLQEARKQRAGATEQSEIMKLDRQIQQLTGAFANASRDLEKARRANAVVQTGKAAGQVAKTVTDPMRYIAGGIAGNVTGSDSVARFIRGEKQSPAESQANDQSKQLSEISRALHEANRINERLSNDIIDDRMRRRE